MTGEFSQAKTQIIEVDGYSFAYRELGAAADVALVFLHHYTGVLDDWDPCVVEGLAENHHVILFDNKGVGSSEGKTPNSVSEMASDAIQFIRALGHEKVDLLGFSLGGFVAQTILETSPQLVRKVILAGTGPAGSQGLDQIGAVVKDALSKSSATGKHHKHFLFFGSSGESQAAAEKFLSRLKERQDGRGKTASEDTVKAQSEAILAWARSKPTSHFANHPVFVVNGDRDVMVPTINSFALFQNYPNATLSILPDSGHGAIFQYYDLFVDQASVFLSDST